MLHHGGDLDWEELRVLLHRLWTKAVGAEDYCKAEWRQLEEVIEQMWFGPRRSSRPRLQAASMPNTVLALTQTEAPPAGFELVMDPSGAPAEPRSFQRLRSDSSL